MKLEEVLPAFREGKKIRRFGWIHSISATGDRYGSLSLDNIMAIDWEIVEEKPKSVRQVIKEAILDLTYARSEDEEGEGCKSEHVLSALNTLLELVKREDL